MTTKILITGGFGYVGGRVAQLLSGQPDTQVYLGTRKFCDTPDWINADVVETRWNDVHSLEAACEGVDYILHFAAMNEIDAAKDPVAALQVNGVSTARLIEVAKNNGVKKFVYLSTAHVYGAPLAGYIDEKTCPRPIHPYATSHRAAEDVVVAQNHSHQMTGLVLRLSNSFGMPAHSNVNRWTLLINDLCRQAAKSNKLVLNSSGMQRRDFVTLTDVAAAVHHILNLSPDKIGNGIFNVGGEWAPTIMEVTSLIAERCEEVLGKKMIIVRPEVGAGEISASLDYSIDKLLATGFVLEKNHSEEIDNTLKMCSSILYNEI